MEITKDHQELQTKLKQYAGQWVVLSSDEKMILASGDTIDAAMGGIDKKTHPAPLMIKVPDEADTTFIF